MIQEKIKNKAKKELKKYLKKWLILILKPFIIPLSIILALFLLICYITDILALGMSNEKESNIKNEIKYYANVEYTEEETKGFFESVSDFIAGIFTTKNADWPVIGTSEKNITSYYGHRDAPTAAASTFHSGIDIAAKAGTKLVAIMDGTITRTAWEGASGFKITISSSNEEYVFSYSHSDPNFLVQKGQKVKKGQIVGKVGPKNVYGVEGNPYTDSNGKPTNGVTTGSHCHFTIKRNGETIDPLLVLKKGEMI